MRAATPARPVRAIAALALLGALLATTACGGGGDAPQIEIPDIPIPGSSAASEATGAAWSAPTEVRMPSFEDSGAATQIDVSGANGGYVAARATSPVRLKFQVNCGEMTYNYDLPNDGTPTFFPINMGNGSYGFRIMENIEGSSYAEIDSAYAEVTLSSELDPFLVPNIFCDYDPQSACVAKAFEVTSASTNEGEVVRDVCTFVVDNVAYDYDKAEVLAQSTGYIPSPDATLAEGKGVCFDYASLAAAMLRSMGLPAQVVTGYVEPGDLYHSWIMVYADGTWQTAVFSVTPNAWSRCDVTFASTGGDSFSGSGVGYTDRYIY